MEFSGQSFAGYEIIAKLGEGGFGSVYKARQPALNRLVALKILAPHLAADADFVARFKREATLAASLNHPNLVLVYAAGESDGTHYMAMEFVEGETLRGRIEERGRLQPREALAIAVYVAQALQYAWNKSHLIHRDIKPDNVFLSQTGEVKVGDLGLAKNVGQSTAGMTATGMMMGSPHYISPEQARGLKEIDFRADIYSLGCTLYQMLTGRTPYEGSDPMTVMGLHVNAPPPAMFKTWPQCPMPLALLVGKMLKKNPRERYASYDELIAELTAVHDKIKAAQTASAAPPSGTITFLFTDIEGSTQLWEKHPQAMPVALERHNQILRRTMESHGGFVFKTVGDAFCVAFASAPNAMAAALAAQRALSAEPWGETGPLRVRMALHTGAAEERGGDYFGPTVNRVARVLAAGHGGQILLSNATEQLVRDHLAEGVSLGDLGERSLKNLTRTERIFQINLPDLPTQFPTLRSAAGPSTTRRRRQRMMTYGGAGAAAVVVVLAGFLLWSPWQSRTGVPPVQSTTTGQAGRLSYSNEAALKLLGNVYTNAVGAEMVYIPPGEFMMGSTKEEQAWAAANGGKGERVMFEGETPRKATINQGFWMGRTEVTVGQWKQFVKATGYVTDGEKKGESSVYLGSGKSHAPKKGVNWRNPDFGFEMQDDHPVSCISWNDAVAFCEWLTDRERKAGRAAAGMVVRLPTEVEWEYACRAGTQSKFWWGDSKEDGKGRLNWFGKNDGFEFVASVDSFGVRGRNRFGLADMLGNVAEWCLDDYDATQAHEELWTGNSATHVVRAGSFNSSPSISRCAYRHSASRFSSYNSMGFRFCVGVDVSGARAATASASRGVDDVFLREVAALPAEQQVARVVAKLKELNPGFDGKETHKIKNGEVTELAFLTEAVTDISPVRALKALQELDCGNSYSPPGLLADLTPLRGMALRSFCIVRTKVADLSPLKGMPLQSLSCGGNRITDLSPLQDMPLRSLFVGITEVQDLSPLKGMALTSLSCYSTQVTDLSVLRGMPLKSLTFDFIAARDIEILRSFKSLEQINYLPAAEFWKRVAAGETPKPIISSAAALKLLGNVYTNAVGAEMVYIPPGEFMLGSTKEEQEWAVANGRKESEVKREGEAPRRAVIKQGFWMGRTEVTVGQWKQFVKETGYVTDGEKKGESNVHQAPGKPPAPMKGKSWRNPDFGFEPLDDHPVSCISWNDAVAFCEWLTDRERKAGRAAAGMVVRLPTEVEWEYACRAGRDTKFWWGDSKEDGKSRLNCWGKGDGFEFVAPVDSFRERGRNRFGLADMLGNVYEWCLDICDATQAHEDLWTGNPSARVLRGGSFASVPAGCRCAFRSAYSPSESDSSFGFRLVVGVDLSGATTATASTSRGVDDTFLREVAALPAEQQVARVVAKLKQLNPGFDGQETHNIEDGQVTELAFRSATVADLSPVRALKALRTLQCGGVQGKGSLADLSPLRGMQLEKLVMQFSKVTDLSPLKGMPLRHLSCLFSKIRDLDALRGMPLTFLTCGHSAVHDLSPLEGMALTSLDFHRSPVSDLSPIKTMPLESLNLDFVPKRDTEIVHSVKSLKKINRLPVAEFWKRVEAGTIPVCCGGKGKAEAATEEESAAAATSAGENWQDWMAEQRQSGKTPPGFNDDGTGWVKTKPGMIKLGNSMRDGAARATFTLLDQEAGGAAIGLRSTKDQASCQGSVRQKTAFLQLLKPLPEGQPTDSPRGVKVLKQWPLPPGIDLNREITLEFRAIGEELSFKVNGQLVGMVRDSTCNQEGEVTIYARELGARVSRIEVLNLDGASLSPAAAPKDGGILAPTKTRVSALTTNPKVGEVFTLEVGKGVTMELMGIPPGEFMLGSTKEEQEWAVANRLKEEDAKREGEAPRKTAIKQGFWLGRTEVTLGQWKEFIAAATGYKTDAEKKGEGSYAYDRLKKTWERNVKDASWRAPGFDQQDNHPVCCVNWNDAMAFCEWLTERERKAGRLTSDQVIRLPTEAEWEYACRAGTQTKFWWGEAKEDGKDRLNWSGTGDGFEFTSPVDSYGEHGRNKFGLADILGNVWEWCLDEYDATQAHEECYKGNPGARVLRGGSFIIYSPGYVRCASRGGTHPATSDSHGGFRVAVGLAR